jgi:ketosteroid isomerase-like protein
MFRAVALTERPPVHQEKEIPMSAEAIRVFETYIDRFNRAVSGEDIDPFEMFAENCTFFAPGQTALSGKFTSLEAVKQVIFAKVVQNMARRPGSGFHIEEYIGDGDRMVALLRGRGGSKLGRPYNNTYFFLFEVKDGKIVDCIEGCDASLINWSVFDLNLVPEETVAG